jgi:hypothetical protein
MQASAISYAPEMLQYIAYVQIPGLSPDGSIGAFLAVFDGHGGSATSDWLEKQMYFEVQEHWQNGNAAKKFMDKAFRVADSKLLAPGGWMGMGERGIGGSKCGSTAAIATVYQVRCEHCRWQPSTRYAEVQCMRACKSVLSSRRVLHLQQRAPRPHVNMLELLLSIRSNRPQATPSWCTHGS